jgi:hypothetical protein
MFISFLLLVFPLQAYINLTLAKTSFNLSDLKHRQFRHDRVKQTHRDIIGLGAFSFQFSPTLVSNAHFFHLPRQSTWFIKRSLVVFLLVFLVIFSIQFESELGLLGF